MQEAPYDQDILAWSNQQAELLRRLAKGEVDLDRLFAAAVRQVAASDLGETERSIPPACPWTLDPLLRDEITALIDQVGPAR